MVRICEGITNEYKISFNKTTNENAGLQGNYEAICTLL